MVLLQADGIRLDTAAELRLAYEDGSYVSTEGDGEAMTRDELVTAAKKGDVLATLTARLGPGSDVDHPQPALWLPPNPAAPGSSCCSASR